MLSTVPCTQRIAKNTIIFIIITNIVITITILLGGDLGSTSKL